MQRQVVVIQKAPRTVDVPLRQYSDTTVDVPGWKEAKPQSYVEEIIKLVDLGEPTSFLDLVYLRCTQRECKSNESIVEERKKDSNHESLSEQLKSYLGGRHRTRKPSFGLMPGKVTRRNACIANCGV